MKRLLIILGVMVGLVHPTFTYHQQEEVAKFGRVRATVDQQKTVEVPAAVSILLLLGGIGLVLLGPRMK